MRRLQGHVLAEEQDPAGIGAEVATDEVEQRRLARAVGTENAERLASGDRQREAVGHLERAKTLAYVLECKYCHGSSSIPPSPPPFGRGRRAGEGGGSGDQ